MNTRFFKKLGAAALLAGAALSASVANAAIQVGSIAQLFGTALIDAAGNVGPLDEFSGGTGTNVNVLIGTSGNALSYSGFNRLNPLTLLAAPNYNALMAQIPVAGPFGFTLLQLPPVVVGANEPGPGVIPTFFRLDTWSVLMANVGSVFFAQGTGVINDAQGNFLSNGSLQFSTQFYSPGAVNSFSATLVATSVIPVPGAMWIFGSGLLLMTAVMRRKVK
jgi:hypothetical protein